MATVDECGTVTAHARGTVTTRPERSFGRQALLIALACLVVDTVAFTAATPDLSPVAQAGALLAIVCVDAALALPARSSGWVTAAHAVTAVGLAVMLRSTPDVDVDLVGSVIAAYRAGAWLHGRASVAAVLVLATGTMLSQALVDPSAVLGTATEVVKDAFIPWLVGRYTSARRAYISELRHHRETELREATEEVDNAVRRVRTTIARDLHDVISHHVSAIGVHSGVARIKLAATQQFIAPEIMDSLRAVELSRRSAMADLRRMLDLLHGKPDSSAQPGLGNLDELFDGVRRSGLATRFRVSGAPRWLPGAIDIALYRMTQEMLTNALRYGDGSTVDIDLDFRETSIVLTARNAIGAPADHASTGRGLAGIRDRAAQFGGTVSHGPDAAGENWETRVSVSYSVSSAGEPQ
ncbi:sensor histidine kinase [Lentzea sp. NPDC059081]|uniref:sensor histidine kinase n=1 Tax=Lentzea sp. NPDC059081 TaxID=3346719 RepID=UPI0036BE05EB